jgi:putative SOS response-associated peptidase YedK
MCGRFTFATSPEIVAEFFELSTVPELSPRYNIAPTQPAPVLLVPRVDAQPELKLFRWGLVPSWAKDPGVGARMINARSETVAVKPAFRTAFRQRRCLVVADGFYEWQKRPGSKQPFYIRFRDAGPFAFAGLWEHWENDEGATLESFAILTTTPNELLEPIHDRMPVILRPEDYAPWMDPGETRVAGLEPLLRPFPGDEMTAYPVSKRVNSPSRDDPVYIQSIAK